MFKKILSAVLKVVTVLVPLIEEVVDIFKGDGPEGISLRSDKVFTEDK